MNWKWFPAAVLIISPSWAADDEGVPTAPLSVWTAGIGGGAVVPINDELQAESDQFFKLILSSNIRMTEHANFFLDLDWFLPGTNLGGDLGFDYMMTKTGVRPFLGAGVGLHQFQKEGANFGEEFGPSATAHLGVLLDLTDVLQIRIRAPFHLVLNDSRDMGAGLDIGFLFGSRFRSIQKLDY